MRAEKSRVYKTFSPPPPLVTHFSGSPPIKRIKRSVFDGGQKITSSLLLMTCTLVSARLPMLGWQA